MKTILKFWFKNLFLFFLIPSIFSQTLNANELNNSKVVIVSNAGSDNINNQLCETLSMDVFLSKNSLETYFLDLLDEGVDRTGKFNPPIPKILSDYSKSAFGKFETTYSIGQGNNKDTVLLAVTVINNPQAGIDNTDNTVCYSDLVQSLSTLENATTYFMELVDAGADPNGTFSPSIETLVNNFNFTPVATFQTEYVVIAGGCEDRATLSVTVKEGSYAGKDNTNNEMTRSESKAEFTTVNDAKDYYLGLLDPGVAKNGIFRPSIDRLAINYNENNLGTFRTTYTITNNGCSDSAVLSLTIVEDPQSDVSSLNTSSSLVVYDLSGGVVKTSKVDATETFNKNSSTFSDGKLKQGIYIYKLNDGNGLISTKKIFIE